MPGVPDGPSWLDVVLDEYRSLRQESLQAIDRQHRVLALGTATSGVLLGVGVRAASGSLVAAILLNVLMPLLGAFVVLLWLGEFERMVRAGAHIAQLESRVASRFPAEPPPLTWETALREGDDDRRRIRRLYPTIFAVIVFVLGATGAVAGLVGLVEAKHWLAAGVAVLGDLAVVLYIWRVYLGTELRARVLGGESFTQETLPRSARLLRCGGPALELSKRLESAETSARTPSS